MMYDEGFQQLVAAAAQAVEIRGMAAYWLLAERNRDLVAALSDMRKSVRERWIREDVLPSYEEVKVNIAVIEAKINRAEAALADALKRKDKTRMTTEVKRLTTFGESYMYWRVLLNSCRDIFDACWRLGITVPVPDFEDERQAPRGGGFLAMLDSRTDTLHKKAKAGKDKMDKRAKDVRQTTPISGYVPIEREDDPRRKPLDARTGRIQVEDFDDDEGED